jgi:hypothetical protein
MRGTVISILSRARSALGGPSLIALSPGAFPVGHTRFLLCFIGVLPGSGARSLDQEKFDLQHVNKQRERENRAVSMQALSQGASILGSLGMSSSLISNRDPS